jgi:hypothetical protein
MQDKKSHQARIESQDIAVPGTGSFEAYQNIDASISQYYELDVSGQNQFSATLGAKVKVHFYQARRGIDEVKEYILSLPVTHIDQHYEWEGSDYVSENFTAYAHEAPSKASFTVLPELVLSDKGLKNAQSELQDYLYRNKELELYRCSSLKIESSVGESHTDFTVRVKDLLDEKREVEIVKLQERYGKKEQTLLTRLARAKERVEKEKADSTSSMIETGIAVLGALFGRKSPTKIGTALRKGNKVLKDRGDITRAEQRVAEVEDQIETLEYELEDKIDLIAQKYELEDYEIETFGIKPRKGDIDIEICAIVWRAS